MTTEPPDRVVLWGAMDFPLAHPVDEGRHTAGAVWVEGLEDGGACVGYRAEVEISACPVDPELLADAGIEPGFRFEFALTAAAQELSPPPGSVAAIAWTSSSIQEMRLVDDGETVCRVAATRFAGAPSVAAFECTLALADVERTVELDFVLADGSARRYSQTIAVPTTGAVFGAVDEDGHVPAFDDRERWRR